MNNQTTEPYAKHEITSFDLQYGNYNMTIGNIVFYLKEKFGENRPVYDMFYPETRNLLSIYCRIPNTNYQCVINCIGIAHDDAYSVVAYQTDEDAFNSNLINHVSMNIETAMEQTLRDINA